MRLDKLSTGLATWVVTFVLLVSPDYPGAANDGNRPGAVEDWEKKRIDAIAIAIPATIGVFGPKGKGGGSGVVISPNGYALTNYHVIESCDSFMKCSMPDGKLYDAVIVGIDPTGDLAMIKLLGRVDFPAALFADSDQVKAGDECFAVGNPFLLATDFQPSVSWGIVSAVNRYQYPAGTLLEYADCIQTDAAINPGNSGGGALQFTRRVDWHQWARLFRETGPSQCGGRVCDFDQPNPKFSRPIAKRPNCRSCDSGRTRRDRRPRKGPSGGNSGLIGRVSTGN